MCVCVITCELVCVRVSDCVRISACVSIHLNVQVWMCETYAHTEHMFSGACDMRELLLL